MFVGVSEPFGECYEMNLFRDTIEIIQITMLPLYIHYHALILEYLIFETKLKEVVQSNF